MAAVPVALLLAGPAPAQDIGAVFDLLCGRTLQHFQPWHGNEIEYTAPDGTAYLWYPALPRTITGSWRLIETGPEQTDVCFAYPPGSFPDGDYDGSEFCRDFGEWSGYLVDGGIRNGDPYGLADGIPPFVTTADPQIDPADLIARFPDVAAPSCAAPIA